MTTNPFFNLYNAANEQTLLEDLIIESIRMHGLDVYYLPKKTSAEFDEIYGQDPAVSYDTAIPIEMYVKNVDSFGGDGSFMSKFNIEIRDQMTLTVARKVFTQTVGTPADILRPNEGDLIWFPLNDKMFKIQYSDEKAMFYQLGGLQTWDLTVEMFEYSNETFSTGIPQIDDVETRHSFALTSFAILTSGGLPITDNAGFFIINSEYEDVVRNELDSFFDNNEIQEESDALLDFSEDNPFGDRF